MYQCLFGDADNQARYRSLLGAKVRTRHCLLRRGYPT